MITSIESMKQSARQLTLGAFIVGPTGSTSSLNDL